MRVRVEQSAACTASETVDVPSISSCQRLASEESGEKDRRYQTYQAQMLSLLQESAMAVSQVPVRLLHIVPTSPQPLHG